MSRCAHVVCWHMNLGHEVRDKVIFVTSTTHWRQLVNTIFRADRFLGELRGLELLSMRVQASVACQTEAGEKRWRGKPCSLQF